jgi:hypothetical protein
MSDTCREISSSCVGDVLHVTRFLQRDTPPHLNLDVIFAIAVYINDVELLDIITLAGYGSAIALAFAADRGNALFTEVILWRRRPANIAPALSRAADKGHIDVVKVLLAYCEACLECWTCVLEDLHVAMRNAVRRGFHDVVKLLLIRVGSHVCPRLRDVTCYTTGEVIQLILCQEDVDPLQLARDMCEIMYHTYELRAFEMKDLRNLKMVMLAISGKLTIGAYVDLLLWPSIVVEWEDGIMFLLRHIAPTFIENQDRPNTLEFVHLNRLLKDVIFNKKCCILREMLALGIHGGEWGIKMAIIHGCRCSIPMLLQVYRGEDLRPAIACAVWRCNQNITQLLLRKTSENLIREMKADVVQAELLNMFAYLCSFNIRFAEVLLESNPTFACDVLHTLVLFIPETSSLKSLIVEVMILARYTDYEGQALRLAKIMQDQKIIELLERLDRDA